MECNCAQMCDKFLLVNVERKRMGRFSFKSKGGFVIYLHAEISLMCGKILSKNLRIVLSEAF